MKPFLVIIFKSSMLVAHLLAFSFYGAAEYIFIQLLILGLSTQEKNIKPQLQLFNELSIE